MNANQSVELYEEVLTLFSDASTLVMSRVICSSDSTSQHEVDISKLALTDSTVPTTGSEHKLNLLSERVKWMQSMIDLKDFSMLLCFMSASLKHNMTAFLLAAKTNIGTDNVLLENIARIINSYKLN